MQLNTITSFLTLTITLAWQAGAQNYDTNNVVVQTFAGSGFSGYVDGVGQQTMFNHPAAIVADSRSNLFVLDKNNSCIRKITPQGVVSTFVGGGTNSLPGYGTNVSLATLSLTTFIAIDHSDALWVGEYPGISTGQFSLVRVGSDRYATVMLTTKLATSMYVSEVVGGLCVDSHNNVYVSADAANIIYRYLAGGDWEVFVGSGNSGSADGNGIFTSFNSPAALTADAADNIYVWDSQNRVIRRINQNRDVVTIAGRLGIATVSDGVGTGGTFGGITSLCADTSGNIYIASFLTSSFGSSIRRMDASTNATTIAGSFTQTGDSNGQGNIARFGDATGVCVSQGRLFVADSGNNLIRQIASNPTSQPVSPANLQLSTYPGLQIIGTVGRTYQIQSSPDMIMWSTGATLLLTSSPYLWIDQNPVGGIKFYRAFLLP